MSTSFDDLSYEELKNVATSELTKPLLNKYVKAYKKRSIERLEQYEAFYVNASKKAKTEEPMCSKIRKAAKSDDPNDAIDIIAKALEAEPLNDSNPILEELMSTLTAAEKFGQCAESFREKLHKFPFDSNTHHALREVVKKYIIKELGKDHEQMKKCLKEGKLKRLDKKE